MSQKTGWTEHQIAGHVCHLFIPQSVNVHNSVVIALHDIAGDGFRDRVLEGAYEHFGFPVVAPVTGHSWWADKIVSGFESEFTPETFICHHVVSWIESELGSASPQIAIFGQGMGGHGALRMAYKHPTLFPIAAAINPDLDFQRNILLGDEVLFALYGGVESARQDSAILHIHPLNWPRHQFFCCDPSDWDILQGVDRLRMKLGSIGIPFECDTEAPRGFLGIKKPYFKYAVDKAFEFMAERLEKERLRVV